MNVSCDKLPSNKSRNSCDLAITNKTDVENGTADDQTGFEIAYSYAINDNVTVKPGYFTVEDTGTGEDDNGFVLETAFSF